MNYFNLSKYAFQNTQSSLPFDVTVEGIQVNNPRNNLEVFEAIANRIVEANNVASTIVGLPVSFDFSLGDIVMVNPQRFNVRSEVVCDYQAKLCPILQEKKNIDSINSNLTSHKIFIYPSFVPATKEPEPGQTLGAMV